MAKSMVRSPRKLPWLKGAFQVAVLALVSWGITRVIIDARGEFREAGLSIGDLEVEWLLAAAVFYLAGIFPFCIFWQKSLIAFGQAPRFPDALRAYYLGNLGKYVPGKALVVVIRTGLIRGPLVNTTVAAASVFVETLTMVAIGAVVAFLVLCLLFLLGQGGWLNEVNTPSVDQQRMLATLALALACGAGIPTLPPVFRRIIRVLRIHSASPELLSGLDFRLIANGWLLVTVGWLILGLSLWAILQAIPDTPPVRLSYELALVIACVSLAMVAGFLSLLPGGLGVREYVVMSLLSPTYGAAVAIVAAVALRVVWLFAELVAAALLYIRPRNNSPE